MSGYSTAMVAKQLGVSYATIHRRVKEGLIPAVRLGPKTTRISRETLIALKTHGLAGLPEAKAHGYRS